jgi:hypothetical protein
MPPGATPRHSPPHTAHCRHCTLSGALLGHHSWHGALLATRGARLPPIKPTNAVSWGAAATPARAARGSSYFFRGGVGPCLIPRLWEPGLLSLPRGLRGAPPCHRARLSPASCFSPSLVRWRAHAHPRTRTLGRAPSDVHPRTRAQCTAQPRQANPKPWALRLQPSVAAQLAPLSAQATAPVH